MVFCYTAQGNAVPVPEDALTFRPAVYGIFIDNDEAFLLRHPETQLFYPPGRILTEYEVPRQTIRLYFRQLTGMMPQLGPLLFVEERYFMDEEGKAWHLTDLYYVINRLDAVGTAESSDNLQPIWVPLTDLPLAAFQFGYEAVQAGRLRLKLNTFFKADMTTSN